MKSPYPKRRRAPSIVRNFWIYRRLVAAAFVLGMILWFVWVNGSPVTVSFPFRLGSLNSTAGLLILLSALVGSVATLLLVGVFFALRSIRGTHRDDDRDKPAPTPRHVDDELPPAGYAARASADPPRDPH